MEIKTLYGNLTKFVNFWAFLLKIFDILDSFFDFLNKKFDFWWELWQPFLLPIPQIVRRRRVPLSCSWTLGNLYVYGKTYTKLRIRITYTFCVLIYLYDLRCGQRIPIAHLPLELFRICPINLTYVHCAGLHIYRTFHRSYIRIYIYVYDLRI